MEEPRGAAVKRTTGTTRMRRDGIEGVSAIEIEPGRAVPNDWNRWLVERWSDRKARLQAARA